MYLKIKVQIRNQNNAGEMKCCSGLEVTCIIKATLRAMSSFSRVKGRDSSHLKQEPTHLSVGVVIVKDALDAVNVVPDGTAHGQRIHTHFIAKPAQNKRGERSRAHIECFVAKQIFTYFQSMKQKDIHNQL